MMNALLRLPLVQRSARQAADWIDLEWSLLMASVREAAPRAHGRLLDVGCGDKPYEAIFAPHVTEYVGIEHEGTFATTQASSRSIKPDHLYDGRTLPFPDASFDTVLSTQVLEHTDDPFRLVSEMARVLRPGGSLLLSVPFSFRLHEEPYDFFRYTPHGLRSMCERVGLEVREMHPHGSLWSVVGHKLNSYLALHVGRSGALAQSLGKGGHEAEAGSGPRLWALGMVAPAIVGIAAAARVLDRIAPDPTESLGYLVIASKPG